MSAAELTALSVDRHPWDWYVDEGWETEALLRSTPIGHEMFVTESDVPVWDPCCGRGAILWAFAKDEFSVIGSDIAARGCRDEWFAGEYDFLELNASPHERVKDVFWEETARLSIAFNPPYSLQNGEMVRGLTERFCRRAIRIATDKVCALVPTKWLSSQGRFALFNDHPPRAIYILSERASMPPGTMIDAMGDAAFQGGKIDYMWVIWDNRYAVAKGGTRIGWIEPRDDVARAFDKHDRKMGLRP